MKIFRLAVMFFGSISLLTGMGSCKKDDDKTKCCTYKYSYLGQDFTFVACEDGSVKLNGQELEGYDWREDYSSWDEFVESSKEDGAVCD